MIANLDEIDEISSTSRSIPESRESRRRRPSPVAAGGMSLCCMCGMIAGILMLAAGIITAVVLLFTLSWNQTNSSDAVNTYDTSITSSSVSTINTTITGGISSVSSTSILSSTTNNVSSSTTSLSSTTTVGSTTTTITTVTTTSKSELYYALVAPQQLHRPSRLHPIRAHQVGIVLLYSINAITTVPLEV
ncbi:unnamed protein product, partial [Rotaria sordida]